MNDHINDTLDQLMGETKVYMGKEYLFEKYKEKNEVISIFTNRRTFVFTYAEIDTFFKNLSDPRKKEFFPELTDVQVDEDQNNGVQVTTTDVSVNGYRPSAENVQLKASLLNVLKELEDKPNDAALQKAKAVCEVANTMVNIQKAETQLIQTLKRKP